MLPWRSDRPLDAPLVRALVRAQFPEVAADDVRYLDEGFDSEVYEVDATWIFRFPKRAEVQAWLEKELRLLPAIAPRLPIPVPAPRFVGRAGPTFPFAFMGYRRLPGTTSRAPDAVDVASVARELGAFLGVLHATDPAVAVAAGATDGVRLEVPAWVERMRARLDAVAPALDAATLAGVRACLDEHARDPAAYDGAPTLVHNDLYEAHVLLDPSGRHVTGVIDWGDAVLGDPALDFAGIAQWLGAEGVEAALSAYDRPVDAGLRRRARAGSVAHAVGCLWYGVTAPRPDYAEIGRRSLVREFSRP